VLPSGRRKTASPGDRESRAQDAAPRHAVAAARLKVGIERCARSTDRALRALNTIERCAPQTQKDTKDTKVGFCTIFPFVSLRFRARRPAHRNGCGASSSRTAWPANGTALFEKLLASVPRDIAGHEDEPAWRAGRAAASGPIERLASRRGFQIADHHVERCR